MRAQTQPLTQINARTPRSATVPNGGWIERPRRSPRGSFILGKAVSRRMSANSKEKVPFLFENWKVDKMELPAEVKPALWGVAGGAVAAIVIGFAWGGWVTGGHISVRAATTANSARLYCAILEGCVDNFRHSPDAEANLASLTKIDSYDRHTFIEKGGWATMPGSKEPDQQQSSRFSSGCEGLGEFLRRSDLARLPHAPC